MEDLVSKFTNTFTLKSSDPPDPQIKISEPEANTSKTEKLKIFNGDSKSCINKQSEDLQRIKTFSDLMQSPSMSNFTIQIINDEEKKVFLCTQCEEYLGQEFSDKPGLSNKNKYNRGIQIPPIVFNDELTDSELIKKQRESFFNLRKNIIRHLENATHLKAVASEEEKVKLQEDISKRNEEVGMKIARLIHNHIYEGRSYNSYERDICLMNLMTDIGNQQHSRKFPPQFLETMSRIITKHLSNLLSTPLPCMGGRPRPVSLTADKGTVKGLTRHPVGVNTVLLSQGHITSEFYAGAPLLTGWTGKALAENLLSSVALYGKTKENLPDCVAGCCFDGEYLGKNVPEHICNELNLTPQGRQNFMLRSIWDAAHRLELAEQHSRSKSPIIKKFDKKIHEQIKYFKVAKKHIKLKEEASNMNVKDYEPRQTSDTRFIMHEHKVLCNQFHNWTIEYNYWEKRSMEMQTDKEVKVTSQEVTEAQNSSADLRDVEHITAFLSMLELTDMLGRSSCNMQGTTNFPWAFVDEMENLKKKLEYVKTCFVEGIVPDIKHASYGPDPKVYCKNNLGKSQWEVMKNNLPSDLRPTFQKIPVVLKGELENRPLTRYMKKDVKKGKRTINSEIKLTLKKIADTYITNIIHYIDGYFFNGQNPSGVNTELPIWIKLAKNAFHFKLDLSILKRQESFGQLLSTLIQPLTEQECAVATHQYIMLVARAERLIKDDGNSPQSLKSIIYRLCTVPKLYKGCELAISVMLKNIRCSTSECGMESLVSTIKDSDSIDRPLSIKQLHHELMIRRNGPHPLHPATGKFLSDSLYEHFGGGPSAWTFIRKSHFHDKESVVIARHIRDAPPYRLLPQ